MASSIDYVLYVCEQLSIAGNISYRKMFGEYAIYCDGKVLGLICDNWHTLNRHLPQMNYCHTQSVCRIMVQNHILFWKILMIENFGNIYIGNLCRTSYAKT